MHPICATLDVASATSDTTLVVFHGNMEHVGDSWHIWNRVNPKKIIAFEYPGYGWRFNEVPSQQAILADIPEQVKFINTSCADTRVIICGRSLGSFAAMHLAVALGPQKCRGVVLLSPLLSAVATVINPPLHKAFAFVDYADNESIAKKMNPKIPVFVAHGTADKIVPMSNAVGVFMALPKLSKKTFHPVENGNHNDLVKSENMWDQIVWFIASLGF